MATIVSSLRGAQIQQHIGSAIIVTAACASLFGLVRRSFWAPGGLRPGAGHGLAGDNNQRRLLSTETWPYPPDAFPGARDVETSYGTIKVFEWGPEDGTKVLLLPGASTPCIALGDMADEFVRNGCRVMLLDLFGRGYSDAPKGVPYDERLFASQLLLAVASSPLSWTGSSAFHLLGFSLGGAIAASFAAYHANLLRSVTVVCPGGLVRMSHVGWKSRLIYSKGWFPDSFMDWLVKRRLEPPLKADDTFLGFDDEEIAGRGGVKVGHLVKWQLDANPGFARAYRSTIQHAPIYGQHDGIWKRLSRVLASRRLATSDDSHAIPPGLQSGRICIVLGESDPIVVKDEWIEDAQSVLGRDGVDIRVLDGGHEIGITKGKEIARIAIESWSE